MAEQEKRKVDIYSLYKKEKTVRVEDEEGNYVDVLLVKMTQGQRRETLESYNAHLENERVRLREREEKFHTLALAIERYATDDFITGIIAFESAQRGEIADLYPAFEGKSEEEREKLIDEEIKKFAKSRHEELSKKTREELKQQFVDLTVESQALLNSVRILNYRSLAFMCLDPESRQPIFESIDDIERICDRRVIDKLIESMTEFRALETQKEACRIATSDQNFLAVGESQKS